MSKPILDKSAGTLTLFAFDKGQKLSEHTAPYDAVVQVLDTLGTPYHDVDVLSDPEIREGIKEFSSWPTIPQLYINKEFTGGCDVVKQLFNSGALHEALGMEAPDRTPPHIEISDAAAEVMRNALGGQPGMSVHLSIDGRWQHNFALGPAEGHEVKTESNGVEILLDVGSAQKARGLKVDMVETLQGTGFEIKNPNAPGASAEA